MNGGHDVAHAQGTYYVPHGSRWPIIGSVGLGVLVVGIGMSFNGHIPLGPWIMAAGTAIMLYMVFGWFRTVIGESRAGLYNAQVDRSFRQGMGWFIVSEVMFFGAFFGALFYARVLAVPWLGGEGVGLSTNIFLWPEFEAAWPTAGPEALGGAFDTIGAWGIPAVNTAILLASGATITWAHWGLKRDNQRQLIWGLVATIVLGVLFLAFQVYEFGHAYRDLNLTLASGIYGSTFYLLTGFHGLHVTLGVIMLAVILLRSLRGHFSSQEHFGFEAVAWYWHFVDVVWLVLFVFVYWL
ncbi:cytochrome c oxidase subunit 3 [Thioalkalivibrio nitratireducens]